MKCEACERKNRDDARFCDSCGAPLETGPAPAEAGERRQITILFCDLVDSVSLSTHLDPEDFGQLIREYEAAGHRAVSRFDGHVAQYLGDGLVVYFGYPQARERASELAVHAGLALLDEIAAIDHEHAGSLAVRVGIHTGEVVVQAMGRGNRRDPLALGDVVNIAARAQKSHRTQHGRSHRHHAPVGPRQLRGGDPGLPDDQGGGSAPRAAAASSVPQTRPTRRSTANSRRSWVATPS